MLSFRRMKGMALAAVVASMGARASTAYAQQSPQGFAVERFYPAAPGGGWMVMDDLGMHGEVGGAIQVSSGYAHHSLRVSDGSRRVSVVSDQAFVGMGAALTVDRFRLYLNLDSPLSIKGDSGTVGAFSFTAPSVDLGANPDTISDARVGFDARIFGAAQSPFRLGLGAQLIIPSGTRDAPDPFQDYVTDGTYRGMGRVLFAGDVGPLLYAGQLGVHLRPRDDSPAPGGPQGSELLFGIAGGPRFALGSTGQAALIIGPEIYGETAFRSFFGSTTTGLEGLLTGRIEGTGKEGPQLRVKIGTGAGLNPHFGAPAWRCVFAIELFQVGSRK